MKAALIPPIPHLDMAANEPLHLVLSHLLEDKEYRAFYRTQRLRGAYLILDNGAHENTAGEAMADLLLKAYGIRANEVVLPDTLFDADATVRGTREALDYLLGEGQDRPIPRMMLVPQGATRQEWNDCFEALVVTYQNAWAARPDLIPTKVTIGVSKDYDEDKFEGGHIALLEHLASFRQWLTFDVHLLGWARDLHVLTFLRDRYPWIRSTDSAKPFVYASHGVSLEVGTSPAYPRRRPDYFKEALTPEQVAIAAYNVEVFKEAAGDR